MRWSQLSEQERQELAERDAHAEALLRSVLPALKQNAADMRELDSRLADIGRQADAALKRQP